MDAGRVQATHPVIEITTQNAQMHITNNRPRMRVSSERPVMTVQNQAPTFKTNHTNRQAQPRQARPDAESAMRTEIRNEQRAMLPHSNLPEEKTEGMQAAPAKIDNIMLAPAGSLDVTVPEVPEKLSVESFGENSPLIEWDSGHMSIEWSDCVLQIDWDDVGGPQIEVEPHSVEVSVCNQPVVRFKLNPKQIPVTVGKQLDAQI